MALALRKEPSQQHVDMVLYEQAYPDCGSMHDVDVTDACSPSDDTYIGAAADAGQLAGLVVVNGTVSQLVWVLAPAERALTLRLVRCPAHDQTPALQTRAALHAAAHSTACSST